MHGIVPSTEVCMTASSVSDGQGAYRKCHTMDVHGHSFSRAWRCTHPPSARPAATLFCAQILSMMKNSHYLYRMTVLLAMSLLASIVPQDVLINNMLPVIISASKDKVRAGQAAAAAPAAVIVMWSQPSCTDDYGPKQTLRGGFCVTDLGGLPVAWPPHRFPMSSSTLLRCCNASRRCSTGK